MTSVTLVCWSPWRVRVGSLWVEWAFPQTKLIRIYCQAVLASALNKMLCPNQKGGVASCILPLGSVWAGVSGETPFWESSGSVWRSSKSPQPLPQEPELSWQRAAAGGLALSGFLPNAVGRSGLGMVKFHLCRILRPGFSFVSWWWSWKPGRSLSWLELCSALLTSTLRWPVGEHGFCSVLTKLASSKTLVCFTFTGCNHSV